jgi:hypothetical protein
MLFDIFRDETGYTLFLSPPLVPSERVETGLTRREVEKRLRQFRDPDIRNETEAFSDADDFYKRGWTSVVLELRYILSRAIANRSTPDDVAFVRRTLADMDYPYPEGHLRHLLRLLAVSERAQGRKTEAPPTW